MGRDKLPKNKVKSKVIRFRINEESYKELEKIAHGLEAGTANAFIRKLAERVLSAGSTDVWKVENEKS